MDMGLRWGIIGAGSLARRRAMPAVRKARNASLRALMVRDLDRARALAEEYRAERYYGDVDDLLRDREIDAVHVATPVYVHCEHAIKAAEHGKHVLCEKPMAMNAEEARRILDACAANAVHLQICFVLRFWSHYRRIKALIESGALGRVVTARAQLVKRMQRSPGAWRTDPARAGGGALMDTGAHCLDLLRYLVGEIEEVACFGSSAVFGWEVEDSATGLVRFESGARGTFDVSFGVPHSESLLEVYGTEGCALVGKSFKIYRADTVQEEDVQEEDLYLALIEHFGRCVETGEIPIATGEDGLRNMELIEMAYEK